MLPHQQERPADPPGVIKLYLINAARVLAWGAYSALVYVCLLRGLELTRDTAVPLIIGKVLFWEIQTPISIWFPLFPVAFFLAALLPLATKYCIAFIVSIKGKDSLSRWAKGILTVITLACIVSTLTATGPLMIESSAGKYREAAVKGELVEARLAAEKQIYTDMQQSLQTMKEGRSVEAAAAREGVAGWSAKVAIAKKQLEAGQLDQARYDRIERASSTAAAREDLERQMREQQVKIASLPTASTAVTSVKSDESHGAQQFAEVTSAWWPLVSFFALEMIAVFFGLIQLVLELTRDRQLADWEAVHGQPTAPAGIDTLAIEDQTDTWQVQPQDVQYDEDGNELVKVRRKKEEYYRRKSVPKAKKKDDPRAAQMFDGLNEDGQNPQSEVSDVADLDGADGAQTDAVFDTQDGGASSQQATTGLHIFDVSGETSGVDAPRDEEALSNESLVSQEEMVGAFSEDFEGNAPAGVGAGLSGTESLTHAQEDQQAVPELSPEVGFSDGEFTEPAIDNSISADGGDDSLSAEGVVDVDDSDEVVIEETLLPNNEGVLVRTEEEIEDLERQYAARRAATEAAE